MFEELKNIVGEDDAAFDSNELKQYSHDMASIPRVFRKLATSMADAVVRPQSTEEVSAIVKFAAERKVPIIPRGMASSALGGVIPTKGGIIIDMTKMNRLIKVDSANETAAVEAGIAWQKLDLELKKYGFCAKSYPTSAPSSTVAGWISTGGFGVGSLQYGHIREHIKSMTVVTPDGKINELTVPADNELINALVATEGEIAIITEVTLSLRKLPETTATLLLEFKDDSSPLKFMNEVTASDLTPYFMKFENSASSKARGELETEASNKIESSTVIVRFEGSNCADSIVKTKSIAGKYGGNVHDAHSALHHWDERFYPMRVKKKGPSLLAAEFIIPSDSLEKVINETNSLFKKRNIEVMTEVHIIAPKKALVMATYLTDERKTEKYIEHLLIIDSALKIAFKHGGMPYGTGIWNAIYINKRFSSKELEALKALKKKLDPNSILNPGKFFEFRTKFGPVLPFLHSLGMMGGGKLASLGLKIMGPSIEGKLEGEAPSGLKDIEKHAQDLWSCAKCGFCVAVCPTFEEIGWEGLTARGKIHTMMEALKGENPELTNEFIERAYQCTTCGACKEVCQTGIETVELWESMRRVFCEMNKGPLPQHEALLKSIKNYDNPLQQPRTGRDRWMRMATKEGRVKEKIKDISKDKSSMLYHVGCIGSFDANVKEVAYNTAFILQSAGVDFAALGKKELCCASTLKRVGDIEFENVARKTLDLYNSLGVETVVTSCSGCYKTFKEDYPLLGNVNFKVKHIIEVLEELINAGKLKFKKDLKMKVTYHDPCHLGRHTRLFEPPRNVIKAIPGIELVEMERNRENSRCCGAGGGFRIAYPDVQAKIAVKRVQDAEETGASAIVSGCPFCYAGIQTAIGATGSSLKMVDITEIVAMALEE